MLENMTIIKNNHLGQEVWRYPGKLLDQSANGLLFEAYFNRSDLDFNGVVLKEKDRFLELYLYEKFFNIYEIYDRDSEQLKAWYCNITRPIEVRANEISYDDLALDLLVLADGRQLVLDEDEFEELKLSDDLRNQALAGLRELQTLFERNIPMDVTKLI